MAAQKIHHTVEVNIPDEMKPYLGAAIARVGYLHPDWTALASDAGARLEIADEESAAQARREVLYAVYREKILSQTMEMRRALLRAVLEP